MTPVNQLRKISVEQSQKQSSNMGTVSIGIGHDNYLVIAEFCQIKFFRDCGTHSDNKGSDLLVSQHFIDASFFNVKNFASQGKDSLSSSIAALLGTIVNEYAAC